MIKNRKKTLYFTLGILLSFASLTITIVAGDKGDNGESHSGDEKGNGGDTVTVHFRNTLWEVFRILKRFDNLGIDLNKLRWLLRPEDQLPDETRLILISTKTRLFDKDGNPKMSLNFPRGKSVHLYQEIKIPPQKLKYPLILLYEPDWLENINQNIDLRMLGFHEIAPIMGFPDKNGELSSKFYQLLLKDAHQSSLVSNLMMGLPIPFDPPHRGQHQFADYYMLRPKLEIPRNGKIASLEQEASFIPVLKLLTIINTLLAKRTFAKDYFFKDFKNTSFYKVDRLANVDSIPIGESNSVYDETRFVTTFAYPVESVIDNIKLVRTNVVEILVPEFDNLTTLDQAIDLVYALLQIKFPRKIREVLKTLVISLRFLMAPYQAQLLQQGNRNLFEDLSLFQLENNKRLFLSQMVLNDWDFPSPQNVYFSACGNISIFVEPAKTTHSFSQEDFKAYTMECLGLESIRYFTIEQNQFKTIDPPHIE